MDDAEIAVFIVVMTVLVATAVLILNWIRGRHRIAEVQARNVHLPEAGREIELLSRENAGLRGKVDRLEERLSVLERIATDDGHRLTQEIEALRLPRN
jgi:cell division protein FtsB